MGKILGKKIFFAGQTSSVFKKANLVSMSKATTENDRNISTKIIAASFENEIGSEEVSQGEFENNLDLLMPKNLIIAWRW